MKPNNYYLSRNKTKSPHRIRRSCESCQCKVYAILLHDSVIEDPAYLAANPNHVKGMPHLYIGATSLDPEDRFQQHLSGHRNASTIAHKYGIELRMDLVPHRQPTRRTWAFKFEKNVARNYRARGCGVWQA